MKKVGLLPWPTAKFGFDSPLSVCFVVVAVLVLPDNTGGKEVEPPLRGEGSGTVYDSNGSGNVSQQQQHSTGREILQKEDRNLANDLSTAKSFLTMRNLLPPHTWIKTTAATDEELGARHPALKNGSQWRKPWRETKTLREADYSTEYYDEYNEGDVDATAHDDDYYYDYDSSPLTQPMLRMPPNHIQAPFPQRRPLPPLPPTAMPRTVRLHPITRQLEHNLEQMRRNKRRRYFNAAFVPSPQDPYWRGKSKRGKRTKKRAKEKNFYHIRPEEIVDHYQSVFKQQMDDEAKPKPKSRSKGKRPRLLRLPVTPRSPPLPPPAKTVIPSSLSVRRRPVQPPNWDFLHTNVQEYFHQRPDKGSTHKSKSTPHPSRLFDTRTHHEGPPNSLPPNFSTASAYHGDDYNPDPIDPDPIDPDHVSPYFRGDHKEQELDGDVDLFPRLFGDHNGNQDHHETFPDISNNLDNGNPLDVQPFHGDDNGFDGHHPTRGGIHQPDLTTTTTTGPMRCHRQQEHEPLFPSLDRKDSFNAHNHHYATSTTVGPRAQVNNNYKKYGSSLSLDPVNAFEISSFNKGKGQTSS